MSAQRRFDENDPLAIEQRRHAETEHELDDTKRQLGHAHRRCLELHEQARRQLSAEAIDAVLQEAVDRNRIWPDDVDEWRKKLEESPSEAIVELAQPASTSRAYSEAEDEAYRRETAARHKLRPDEVL